jgi:hypothetical protein
MNDPYLRLTYAQSECGWTCQQFCTSMYLTEEYQYPFQFSMTFPSMLARIYHTVHLTPIHVECFSKSNANFYSGSTVTTKLGR